MVLPGALHDARQVVMRSRFVMDRMLKPEIRESSGAVASRAYQPPPYHGNRPSGSVGNVPTAPVVDGGATCGALGSEARVGGRCMKKEEKKLMRLGAPCPGLGDSIEQVRTDS